MSAKLKLYAQFCAHQLGELSCFVKFAWILNVHGKSRNEMCVLC